jgi:hypothetical protein
MYAPHTASLINQHGEDFHLTILRGVMIQDMERMSVLQAGDYDSSYTKVFIPFTVDARNADGDPVTYLPPKQYAKSMEPEQYWTLQADGDEAGRSSFIVKGEIPEACSLAEARENYDGVFIITTVSTRDYGQPGMQHWEASSRINERSGMNYE